MTISQASLKSSNPLIENWSAPFGAPLFGQIKPALFHPAFERAFAEHEAEVETIANNPSSPTFENTIHALESSGRTLERVDNVFSLPAGGTRDPEALYIAFRGKLPTPDALLKKRGFVATA